MPAASSTPTVLGLYINSFKKGSNTDPYTQLLGTDGYGNYSSGNKIDNLGNYISQYGYNYGLFYGTSSGDFTSTVTSETFLTGTGVGSDILNNVLPRFHNDYGMTLRAAILDVAQPQMISVGSTYSSTDGISQIKKIINWNQSVGYAADKIFNWINIETEFWNFPYDDAVSLPGNVVALNAVNAGFNRGELRASPAGSFTLTGLGVGVNDFICLNNQWRQVISISSNLIIVDRPWTTTGIPGSWKFLNFDGTVDYETFLYRIQKACQYIQDFGSGELVDIYVGFPSYTFKGTLPAGYPQQLAKLYQAGVNKILITAYQRFPNFSYMNGNYASAPSGGYRRISDDIISDSILRKIGVIFSMESTTLNNSSCPTNNTNNNFSGYIMEGKSITPHSTSTDFKAVDAGNIPIICACCATPLTEPPVTYNPLSLDELWQYVAEIPPSGGVCPACYPTQTVNTFNEEITAGGTTGTNLNSYIEFDTMIVFDQEFMRQLNITPVIDFTLNITKSDASCFGVADGIATVDITGGVAPYTFQWEIYDAGTSSWITYHGTGAITDQITYVHGTYQYRCIVTDNAATSVTSAAVTVTEPAVIDFTGTPTSANCAGLNGSITISGVTGGTSPYLYSIVPTTATKVWTGNLTATGLAPGVYDVSVASGNPTNGCFVTKQVTVGASSSFTISQVTTNITCNGGSNGSITLTPSPTGSYTYNLYNASAVLVQTNTTGIFNNLTAGVYTSSGTNSIGCNSNSLGATITQPTAVTASEVITNPTCYNSNDAQVIITGAGGNSPYEYTLTFPGGNIEVQSSSTFINLVPGNYSYFVTDTNNCISQIYTFAVVNPNDISALYTVQQINENNLSGSITLQGISGGTAPYTYLWNTGATTNSITDLVSGNYSVIITSASSCTKTYNFSIYSECQNLSLNALKVQLFKFQCCSGILSKKYVKEMRAGQENLARCTMQDIKVLSLILDAIKCIDTPGSDYCLSCEDLLNIIEQGKILCECDCCDEQDKQSFTVQYNPDTNELDIIE